MISRKLLTLLVALFVTGFSDTPFITINRTLTVIADGSGPVPPLPNPPVTMLLADGSGPVPPLPQPPLALLADGSGPVPPLPLPSQTVLFADGSGPVPPLPRPSALNTAAV
jgi:hypothetical protein